MKLIDIPVVIPSESNDSFYSSLDMMSKFYEVMHDRGQSISDDDAKYAFKTFYAWTRHEPMKNPVVIAAECGFGKSTLLEIFVRNMVRTSDSFGCIVVKQKIEEVEVFVEAINTDRMKHGLARRHDYAFGIYGYDASRMSFAQYQSQFSRQTFYPVLVMTAEMFARQSNMRNLDRFSSFYDKEEVRHRRNLLLIDERPVLTKEYTFTFDRLNELSQNVRRLIHQLHGKDTKVYSNFNRKLQKLRVTLEEYRDETRTKERIEPIDRHYLIDESLRRDWSNHYEGDDFDALSSFEKVIRHGGIVSVKDGEARLMATQKTHYEWMQFNPFILDATAETDPYYDSYDFHMFRPDNPHVYSNMTFYVGDGANLSKMFFNRHPQSIQSVSDMVKEISTKHKKTMLVSYKENIPKLSEQLINEIESGKIAMKHFDSGRSTNDYRDCDAAVFLGWLLKGDLFYPEVASAIYDRPLGIDSKPDQIYGFKFLDPQVEQFKVRDMVTERIQDIHRVRPRSKVDPISVYLFHKDEELLDGIIDNFSGAKKVDFVPLQKLSGKEDAADLVINFFKEMRTGQRVKGKELYEQLNIHRNTFSQTLKDQRVMEAMKRYGITKEKTFYRKSA